MYKFSQKIAKVFTTLHYCFYTESCCHAKVKGFPQFSSSYSVKTSLAHGLWPLPSVMANGHSSPFPIVGISWSWDRVGCRTLNISCVNWPIQIWKSVFIGGHILSVDGYEYVVVLSPESSQGVVGNSILGGVIHPIRGLNVWCSTYPGWKSLGISRIMCVCVCVCACERESVKCVVKDRKGERECVCL